MQDREQEGRGLAAAGHRACEEVVPGHRQGDCVGLNGSWTRESEVFEPLEQAGMETER